MGREPPLGKGGVPVDVLHRPSKKMSRGDSALDSKKCVRQSYSCGGVVWPVLYCVSFGAFDASFSGPVCVLVGQWTSSARLDPLRRRSRIDELS